MDPFIKKNIDLLRCLYSLHALLEYDGQSSKYSRIYCQMYITTTRKWYQCWYKHLSYCRDIQNMVMPVISWCEFCAQHLNNKRRQIIDWEPTKLDNRDLLSLCCIKQSIFCYSELVKYAHYAKFVLAGQWLSRIFDNRQCGKLTDAMNSLFSFR